MPPARFAAFLTGAAWLGVVGWCTLRPLHGVALARHQPVPWSCLLCGSAGLTDVLLNLLLFLPLGMAGKRAGWRWWPTVVTALVISLAIEVTQGLWLPGRDASLSDLLTNTLGAVLGWWFMATLPGRRTAPGRWATAILLIQTAIWFGTPALLAPAVSGPGPWHGARLTPDTSRLTVIHSAAYAGIPVGEDSTLPLPPAPLPLTRLSLDLTQRSADQRLARVVVLRVRDADGEELMAVDQGADRITLGLRLGASAWRFRAPGWTVATEGRIRTGERTSAAWMWDDRGVTLTLTPTADTLRRSVTSLPFSVALGWSLVHPFVSRIDGDAPWWSLLWIAWWFGCLGWLAAPLGSRRTLGCGAMAWLIFWGAGMVAGWPVLASEMATAVVSYGGMALITNALTRQRARHMERRAL